MLVIPCLRTGPLRAGSQAGLWGSLLPAAWSYMLAARARGLGSAWTTLHLRYEREIAELLDLPSGVHQGVLIPTAYYTGETFRPAPPVSRWTRSCTSTAGRAPSFDATVDNGRLWVIPGSHRAGVLYPVRDQHDPHFDCTQEAHAFPHRDEDGVAVELAVGDALIFDGYPPHRSLPNTGRNGMRRALVNHYMSAESLLPWFRPREHDAMGTLEHRDVELVAGADLYAFKGIADVLRPHVRPDGQGGCLR